MATTDDNLIDRNNNCGDLNNTTTTVFIEKENVALCDNHDRGNMHQHSNGTLIGTLLSSSSLKIHVNPQSDACNDANSSMDSNSNKSNISIVNCSNSNNVVPNHSDNNINGIIEVHNTSSIEDIETSSRQQHLNRINLISTESQTDIHENEIKLAADASQTTNRSNNSSDNNVNNGGGIDSRAARRIEQQNRRERRRDRQARCLHHPHHHAANPNAPSPNIYSQSAMCRPMDILPTVMPPPYTTLPGRGTSTTPFVPSLLTTVGPVVDDLHYSFPIPMIRRTPSERSGKGCCFRWFSGSPFRVILCILALGGITCAIGGICIGTTTIIGSSASHLTTSLIMIGFGIIILTLSGLAWKFSVSTTNFCWNDFDTCSRRSYNRTQRGIYYPEFQHRPPPPSYQASMQEYRLRLLLLDRERPINIIRVPSPPPTYRSHNSTLVRSTLNQSDFHLPPSYNTTNSGNQLTMVQQAQQSENVPEQIDQLRNDRDEQQQKNNEIGKSDCKNVENNERNNISSNSSNELVTIVTISGYTDNGQGSNEMEVLAHL